MMQQNLLKVQQVMSVCIRSYARHNKKAQYMNDAQLYEKVRYYPRVPDFKEDPIENPTKLFRVQRIKVLKGTPYWERRILQLLGLTRKMSDVTVVKNIPEMNAMLWKVKHLVDIKPVVFPYGEPTENDINHSFLKESGECIVTKEIKFDEKRLEARNKFDEKPERLDGKTLAYNSRLKWLSGYEC
ncbi:39S ribosomal protein L30, mitochondrial [Pseudolycoriella hygida]|uniref:Large ribosomal subunit protein uL30m n=1 Tax=Pseudolycoriella hygida TaxID=35572 RepID=A0A9Q0RWP4_9DIPT|nr:39S ribosomal protein L30, mitochondrial [Pseudolycoriella hygida]